VSATNGFLESGRQSPSPKRSIWFLPGGAAVPPCVALSAGSRRHAARHPCRIAALAHEREESRQGRDSNTASSDGIQRLLIWCQDICKASGPSRLFPWCVHFVECIAKASYPQSQAAAPSRLGMISFTGTSQLTIAPAAAVSCRRPRWRPGRAAGGPSACPDSCRGRWASSLERLRSRQSPRTRALARRQPIFRFVFAAPRQSPQRLSKLVRLSPPVWSNCGCTLAGRHAVGGPLARQSARFQSIAIGTDGLASLVLDRTLGGQSFANRHPNDGRETINRHANINPVETPPTGMGELAYCRGRQRRDRA
jgi:hypothetical protein